MSFLTPLFLLGAAAIALPIAFHLIRRTTREKIPFSSLMFLKPTPPRVTRRSRLENLFLLLLRCLVFLLLALGFARPFFNRPMAAEAGDTTRRQRVILVDQSASMRRGNLSDQARDQARAALEASARDEVSLLSFSQEVSTRVDFETWSATPPADRVPMAMERLAAAEPDWKETDVAHALVTALERLEELSTDEVSAQREIVLITDLQSGAHVEALQGMEWPSDVSLVLDRLQPDQPGNAGFQALPDQPFTPGQSRDDTLRIRVQNAEDSTSERFQLAWKPGAGPSAPPAPTEVYVPAGQSRVIQLTWPSNGTEKATLELFGDPHPFDNEHHLVRARDRSHALLFLGREAPEDPNALLFYLSRAFPREGSQRIEVVAGNGDTPLPPDRVESARLLVVSGNPGAAALDQARRFLESGRTVLHVLRAAEDATALGTLLGRAPAVTEASLPNYAMLESLDFRHPLLSPFADPQYNDFTKIHFWKHRDLDTNGLPGLQIIASFDNGAPALAQCPVGEGQLFVLTSGWHPGDSQLALSSKFVPLLFSMMELSGSLTFRPSHFVAGAPVPAPEFGREAAWTVTTPYGRTVSVAAGEPFTETEQPGLYEISATPPEYFAVNLASRESRTSPLPEDMLEQMGLPLSTGNASVEEPTPDEKALWHATELERNQKLWQWLILAALVMLIAETWVAGRLSHASTPASDHA